MKTNDILLHSSEAAARLGVAVRTIRLWAECGIVPAVTIGRQWRFRSTMIDKIETNGDINVKNISVSRQLRQQRHTSGE